MFGTSRPVDTVKNCKICGGKGCLYKPSEKGFPGKKAGKTIYLMESHICICRRNEVIELRFPYLRPDTVPPVSEENTAKTYKQLGLKESRVFQYPQEDFLKLVKRMFVHLSVGHNAKLHMSTGLEVIQYFYVEQADGSKRTINDLIYDRDLVVLMFITQSNNQALAPVMLDIVQGRVRQGLPLWIWSPGPLSQTKEYSEEMAEYIDKMKKHVRIGSSGKLQEGAEAMRHGNDMLQQLK